MAIKAVIKKALEGPFLINNQITDLSLIVLQAIAFVCAWISFAC